MASLEGNRTGYTFQEVIEQLDLTKPGVAFPIPSPVVNYVWPVMRGSLLHNVSRFITQYFGHYRDASLVFNPRLEHGNKSGPYPDSLTPVDTGTLGAHTDCCRSRSGHPCSASCVPPSYIVDL